MIRKGKVQSFLQPLLKYQGLFLVKFKKKTWKILKNLVWNFLFKNIDLFLSFFYFEREGDVLQRSRKIGKLLPDDFQN